MNELERRFKIGQALEGLSNCDIQEYRLAVALLLGNPVECLGDSDALIEHLYKQRQKMQ